MRIIQTMQIAYFFKETGNCRLNRKGRKSDVVCFSELDQTVNVKICNENVTWEKLLKNS